MKAVFTDREEAGRMLADALDPLNLPNPVVLALPRGGVPVAFEIAKRLRAPLDVLFVRKIGAPGHEEYGIGAIVDGSCPQVVIDREAARQVGANEEYIQRQIERQAAEIERRRGLYRTGPPVDLRDRTVIVADDGIATGGTVRAALHDDVVCLAPPEPFYAVGMHYLDFTQTSDKKGH